MIKKFFIYKKCIYKFLHNLNNNEFTAFKTDTAEVIKFNVQIINGLEFVDIGFFIDKENIKKEYYDHLKLIYEKQNYFMYNQGIYNLCSIYIGNNRIAEIVINSEHSQTIDSFN